MNNTVQSRRPTIRIPRTATRCEAAGRQLEMQACERVPAVTNPDELASTQKLVLSVTEAAEILGISRDLAYDLTARGELPSLRLGRRILVPRRALLALLDTE
jgi:excisionase family DNA binding protein